MRKLVKAVADLKRTRQRRKFAVDTYLYRLRILPFFLAIYPYVVTQVVLFGTLYLLTQRQTSGTR